MNLEKFEEARVVGQGHLDHPVVDNRGEKIRLQNHHREEDPGEEDDQGGDDGVDLSVVIRRQLELVTL